MRLRGILRTTLEQAATAGIPVPPHPPTEQSAGDDNPILRLCDAGYIRAEPVLTDEAMRAAHTHLWQTHINAARAALKDGVLHRQEDLSWGAALGHLETAKKHSDVLDQQVWRATEAGLAALGRRRKT